MPKETIGQRIREERKRQGLTMEQLGKKIGISGSLVGRYERGEENPKIETVERFATALNLLVTDLYPDCFCADEVRELEESQSNSFQGRMVRALSELSSCVESRVDEYEIKCDEYCPAEMKNTWVTDLLPEIAQKYDVPLKMLKKYRPFYLNDEGPTNNLDIFIASSSDFSEDGMKVIELLESLNNAGQEAARRHLEELTEIPRYRAESPAQGQQQPAGPESDKDPDNE